MFEVTESASKYFKVYLRRQKIDSAIRVTTISDGFDGPALGIALVDSAQGDDKSFDHAGINFVMEKFLHASCGNIKVDYIRKSYDVCGYGNNGGFAVTSDRVPLQEWLQLCRQLPTMQQETSNRII